MPALYFNWKIHKLKITITAKGKSKFQTEIEHFSEVAYYTKMYMTVHEVKKCQFGIGGTSELKTAGWNKN